MSAAETLPPTAPRPWSSVIPKGAMLLAVIAMIGWTIVFDYYRIFHGDEHGVPSRYGMVFSPEWLNAFSHTFLIVAPSAFAYAALLAGVMARTERERKQSPLYWELAGFAAAVPFLLWAWWAMAGLGAALSDYFWAAIAMGLLSLFVSNAMRKARHGPAK